MPDADGAQASEEPAPVTATRRRRRWPWVVLLVVGLGVAAAIAVAVFAGRAGEETPTEAEPMNTAEVVRTDLVDESTYDGTLGTVAEDPIAAPQAGVVSYAPAAGDTIEFGAVVFAIDGEPVVLLEGPLPAVRDFRLGSDERTITSRFNGTLTSIVAAGDIIEEGDVVATIDGEPVVVLYGDIPAYRSLRDTSDNLVGDDVRQLEEALTRLGFNSDGDVTVDDEFTGFTETMVTDWQEASGMDDDGVVDLGEVIFIPGPAQILTTVPEAGDRVTDGAVLVTLATGDPLAGDDVAQLENALAGLGFDAGGELVGDGTFDVHTVAAVRQLQEAIGGTIDGLLGAGDVRFTEASIRVGDVSAEAGTTVAAGSPVLSLSSTDKFVQMDLPAADQGLLEVGMAVVVELPDGEETPATVTSVAETATVSAAGDGAVFEIEITLDDPSVATGFEQAPVDVIVVSDSVQDVVAVPVSALVALAEGGYAVELVQTDGTARLVAVEPGFYADGFVEISSNAVAPGDRVVVP